MEFKAIFFDAAGTLFDAAAPIEETYALLAKKYGKEVSGREIGKRFRTGFSSAPPLAFPGAEPKELRILERAWWKELVRRVFEPWGPFPQFDGYFSELFDHFSRAESWSLYPETEETLSALKERGFILEVISNFDSRLFGILEGLRVAPWFDSVVISSRAGYAKPAPEIFQRGLGLYRLKAEEVMHVGDSLENDMAGASAAGLTGVLIDRDEEGASRSLPRVRNLKEILLLVDGNSLSLFS